MALPAGWIIQKWGYRRGVIMGLVLFGIGALMFIPGSRINSFYFFVLSLFVIGCGLTCLETSANPYTTVLGHPDKAESRINLSQSLNGIGWIVGPLVGGQLLFSGVNIAIPYALVGIFVLAVALVLSRIKLPDPRRAHEADTNEMVEEKPMRVMAFGFGMLALFLYVAAQTGVNSFFINYAEESIHIEKQTASLYLAFGGMGLFFIGRLAGGVIMNYIQPRLVRNHGVYCGYYGQYGDCLSHTAGMLWGDWRVCVIETPRSSLDKRRIFESPRPSFQRGLHRFPQAPFPSGDRGCNRPPVLRTATLYGCRTIKGLRHVVRDGTAWGKVDRIIEVLVLW
mgnify:CR=1 FL=1